LGKVESLLHTECTSAVSDPNVKLVAAFTFEENRLARWRDDYDADFLTVQGTEPGFYPLYAPAFSDGVDQHLVKYLFESVAVGLHTPEARIVGIQAENFLGIAYADDECCRSPNRCAGIKRISFHLT